MTKSLGTRTCHAVSMAGLLALLLIAAARVCAGAKGEPLKTVVEAWSRRQAAIKSFDVSWEGEMLGLDDLPPPERRTGSAPLPKDMTYPVKMRLRLDPTGRARFDYEGSTWSFEEGRLVPKHDVVVFDGREQTVFLAAGTAELKFPSAYIKPGETRRVAGHIACSPLLLMYRPFDQQLGMIIREKLVVGKQKGVIDGRTCLILKYGEAGQDIHFWIDEDRGLTLARAQTVAQGRIMNTLDIQYESSDRFRWIPLSWRQSWINPKGEIYRSISAKVTACRLNEQLPDEDFRVDFPLGTWVNNVITNEHYITRGEGRKRPVMGGEFTGRNYEQLLNSDPPADYTRQILGGIIGVAMLGSIALLYFRHVKRKA